MTAPSSDRPEAVPGLARFASVVAHELRNPLSAVKIALQTLERHAELEPKDATRLGIALREVATIERMLTAVLDWARPPPLAPAPVSSAALVERALALARPELDELHVAIDRSGEDAVVVADPSSAAAALAELVRNAAQASRPGARVELRVVAGPGLVALEVLDRGAGLSPGDETAAFEPFFTRRAKGVGLGLTRARATARALGGEVTLASRDDGGARARLVLPAA